MNVFVLGLRYDYNGYYIIGIYKSLSLAECKKEELGNIPEKYIKDDLIIDEWEVEDEKRLNANR